MSSRLRNTVAVAVVSLTAGVLGAALMGSALAGQSSRSLGMLSAFFSGSYRDLREQRAVDAEAQLEALRDLEAGRVDAARRALAAGVEAQRERLEALHESQRSPREQELLEALRARAEAAAGR